MLLTAADFDTEPSADTASPNGRTAATTGTLVRLPDSEPKSPLLPTLPPDLVVVALKALLCAAPPTADTASPKACTTGMAGAPSTLPDAWPPRPLVLVSPPALLMVMLLASASCRPSAAPEMPNPCRA